MEEFKPSSTANHKRISSGTLLTKAVELYFSLSSISLKPSKDDKKMNLDLLNSKTG
jgi:hypothetical protein